VPTHINHADSQHVCQGCQLSPEAANIIDMLQLWAAAQQRASNGCRNAEMGCQGSC
jgi:hypothetical protein